MKKILFIIVESIIWIMIFKLIILFTGMTEITLLAVTCAYLLTRINYIENKRNNN